nr:glycosyltransferase [uncultured Carboxylicivirga sp.]
MIERTEAEIISNWTNKEPIVSICCLSYNHEAYIEESIDSFLMQETTFPFEILIHDDASTDNTQKIIKKYQELFPQIIKPIYQTINQKSIYKSGMNPRFNFPRAIGKYIATCEGDDYWTDPLKLQKQVDFLEANTKYAATFHKNKIYFEDKKEFETPNDIIQEITLEKILYENVLGLSTCSALFVGYNIKRFNDWNKFEIPFGDWFIWILCAKNGRINYDNNTKGVYRIHNKGIWNSADQTTQIRNNLTFQRFLDSWYYTPASLKNDFYLKYLTLKTHENKFHEAIIFLKEYIKIKSTVRGRLALFLLYIRIYSEMITNYLLSKLL